MDFIGGFECGGLNSNCRTARLEQTVSTGAPGNSMYYYPSDPVPAQLLLDQAHPHPWTTEPPPHTGYGSVGQQQGVLPRGKGPAAAAAAAEEINGTDEKYSARSTASGESDMATSDREREKTRLQRLLKDFAKEAVAGIVVSLVNPRTGRMPPYLLQMDRHLSLLSLKPKDGSTADAQVQDFKVADIASIYKGHEVFVRAPAIGKEAVGCVGLDMNAADCSLIFHFDDAYDRDKFYTSMQVLTLSAGIQHSR